MSPSPALTRSPPDELPQLVRLTDDQLDQVMRCAAPLHPRVRRLFVEHVALALRGKIIGDGEVWRACASVLRESGMFDPPLESGARKHVGKYAR
jgi:hypothetical protein